ncbi:putative tubby-like protein [Dioscorea sansibarensis]
MTKIHPNAPVLDSPCPAAPGRPSSPAVSVEALTVWLRSLLLNGNGFTVFDAKGNLVFRVDNYASGNKGEIVLMDASGKSLLTIRRKKLSISEQWLIYEGDEATKPCFSVKKNASLIQPKSLAHVSPCNTSNSSSSSSSSSCVDYDVEGSYSKRCCTIYNDKRRPLAEIRRKESVPGVSFDLDVFRLLVYPGFDSAMAMAIVILLEQMYGSRGALRR